MFPYYTIVSYYESELTSSADKLRSRLLDSSSFLFSSRAFLSLASPTVFLITSRPVSSISCHTSCETPSGGSSCGSLLPESENILTLSCILIMSLNLLSDPLTLNYHIPESVSDWSQGGRSTSVLDLSGLRLALFLFRSFVKYFFLRLNLGSCNCCLQAWHALSVSSPQDTPPLFSFKCIWHFTWGNHIGTGQCSQGVGEHVSQSQFSIRAPTKTAPLSSPSYNNTLVSPEDP